MPAVVLVGAQWGDEGKGKATDLLGGGSTTSSATRAATTPATPSSSATRSTPCTCCPPASSRPACVPVIGNGVVDRPGVLLRRSTGCEERGVDTSRLLISRQRAPDHAAPPGAGQGHRALPRQGARSAPPAAASARRTATRWPGSASGSRTCSTRAILRQKIEVALREKNQVLVKVYNRRAIDGRRGRRGVPRLRRAAAAAHRRHLAAAEQGAGRGQGRAARGRPGHAARRGPRHLSVRHLVQPDRRRRVRRLGHRRRPGSPG